MLLRPERADEVVLNKPVNECMRDVVAHAPWGANTAVAVAVACAACCCCDGSRGRLGAWFSCCIGAWSPAAQCDAAACNDLHHAVHHTQVLLLLVLMQEALSSAVRQALVSRVASC